MDTKSDLQAVIDHAAATAGGTIMVNGEGRILGLIHHKDTHFVPLDELNEAPRHRKANIQLATFEAFQAYVTRYHNPGFSIIYSDTLNRKLVCVFDDFPKSEDVYPAWRFHRATLELKLSPELLQWLTFTEYKSQDQFAEFLNLHAGQIVQPAAADILEIVTQFEAVDQASLTSKTRARDGRVQFAFTRESKVLSVDIPGELTIQIPLFAFATPVTLTAQIRFRIRDRGLHFCLVFTDLEDLLKAYWQSLLDDLRTSLPEGSLIVEGQP